MPDIKRVAMLSGLDEARVQSWCESGLFKHVPERTGDWVARALVLAQLEKLGVPREVVKTAESEDALGRAYIFDLLRGTDHQQLTLRQVLQRVEMEEQRLLRFCDALGIDDASNFSEGEAQFFEALDEAVSEGLPNAMAVELCEIWGTQMRFIAAAEVLSYDVNVTREMMSQAPSPLEAAAMLAPVTRAVLRAADLIPQPLHRRHLLQAINLQAAEVQAHPAEELAPGEVHVAIGFVDLAGYTALTEQQGDRQALTYARRLERIVRTHTHTYGVRIVKRLGDGFMLASTSVADMLRAVLAIASATEQRQDMPAARCAIAFGRAVSRAGDYFGHTVNLAARVLDEATPSEVLVTEEVVSEAERGPFSFSDPRDWSLRGMQEPVRAWRVEAVSGQRPVREE